MMLKRYARARAGLRREANLRNAEEKKLQKNITSTSLSCVAMWEDGVVVTSGGSAEVNVVRHWQKNKK